MKKFFLPALVLLLTACNTPAVETPAVDAPAQLSWDTLHQITMDDNSVSFSLPKNWTLDDAGATDASGHNVVLDEAGEAVFAFTMHALQKCPDTNPGCGLGETMPASPEEIALTVSTALQTQCGDPRVTLLGDLEAQSYHCLDQSTEELVFHTKKGAYTLSILGNAVAARTRDAFLSTFKVQ